MRQDCYRGRNESSENPKGEMIAALIASSLCELMLSSRLLFAEIVGYLETIVLYSMFSSRQFQTFGFFLFSIFFI